MAAKVIPFPQKAAKPAVTPMVLAALDAIKTIENKIEMRPIVGGLKLLAESSKCERRCPTCYLECAILPERLQWWENELKNAGGVPVFMLKRGL